MRTRQIIGVVFGVAGVLISIGHLVWMSIRGINQLYHGFRTWVLLGIALTIIGLLLLRKND